MSFSSGLGELGLGELGLGEMGLGEMGGHRLSSCPREQRDTIWAFSVFRLHESDRQVLSQPELVLS